jgi:2-keto-3-deoxy-galactonokinase
MSPEVKAAYEAELYALRLAVVETERTVQVLRRRAEWLFEQLERDRVKSILEGITK